VEPFGGAAGVLFNKPKSKVEVYNDLNGDIVHFFRVLRERPDELKEWLERVPFARELHDKWATEFYNGERLEGPIERAGRFFFLRYSQFGGKIDGDNGFRTSKGTSEAQSYANKVDRLEVFAERLRRVTLENRDWRELLEAYDGVDTVFYLDPPYQGTEGMYESDGFDHYELYQAVCNLEGRCLVSYDSIPHWYGDGFQVVTKDAGFAIDNVNSDGQKEATEVLLMNFDSEGEPRHVRRRAAGT